MASKESFIIIDIGTGNVRVAMTDIHGHILKLATDAVHYEKDEAYEDSLYFEPDLLWKQIIDLTVEVLNNTSETEIKAITVSSQREGVVLMGSDGRSLIGLPNHDHRGRKWENLVKDKDFVYQLTGRYPTSLFSAFKILGIKKKRPDIYSDFSKVMSISDWAQYKLSGISGYEHSQASETLLYDVENKNWSSKLCSIFGIDENVLPKLHKSGTILGNILPVYAEKFNVSPTTVIVVGGADTQLAVKSTMPSVGDIVIVCGTTTPIVKVTEKYTTDHKQRTWTNRHVEEGKFILETNAGVTGLNYQRLKQIFYPNEGYETVEEELGKTQPSQCVASLGSLVAEEKTPLLKGGFIFDVPVSHQLTRASFMWSALWDIACCIKENFEILCDVEAYELDYVWACGGGIQSPTLRQFIANLIDKKILVRRGYGQSSVVGAAFVCTEALKGKNLKEDNIEEIYPENQEHFNSLYLDWKTVRTDLKKIF